MFPSVAIMGPARWPGTPGSGAGGLLSPGVKRSGNPREWRMHTEERLAEHIPPLAGGTGGILMNPACRGDRVEGVAPKVFPCFPVSIRFRGMGGDGTYCEFLNILY